MKKSNKNYITRLIAMILMTCCIITSILVFPQEASAASNNTYGEITEGVAASTKTINALSKKKFYMHPNESIYVSVGSKYSKSKVTWSTSTSSILSYSSKSGYKTKITLKKAGTAKGIVKVGSKRYSFTVVVTTIKVLKTSVSFTTTNDNHYKSREVLYCSSWSSWRDGKEEIPSYIVCENREKNTSDRVDAEPYEKTHSIYLYPEEFGSGDVELTIETENGCKHTYLIKTNCPYNQAMKTAYSTLKQWETTHSKELTDAEIQAKIQEFSQLPGYREGAQKMKCGFFANDLFQYIWKPDYAYVKLSNPTKVLTKKHWSFAYVSVGENMKKEVEEYQSLDELYQTGNLGDGLDRTGYVSARRPYVYVNDFDAIQVGDLIACCFPKNCETGEWDLTRSSHAFIVMDIQETSNGEKWIITAESNIDTSGGPLYGKNWKDKECLELEGFIVISYREPKK